MTSRLRIAVAGAGAIGRRHIALIRARPDCALAAIADPMPGAGALAAECGVPLLPSLERLLASERPDGVVIATPNGLHVPQALACIEAGVPALLEKPVADRLDDAWRLVAVAERRGVPVLVGHHRRHSPVIETAAALVRSGRLGRLVAVQASAVFAKPASYFAEAPWRGQRGGGPILINLVHEIDSLRALAGEIVEVQALASHAIRGLEVEDTVAIGLRFANGALGSLLLSDCGASPSSWEQTSGEDPRYDHHASERCAMLVGTQGSLQLPTLQLHTHAGEPSWTAPLRREQLPHEAADPLQRQLAHFCAVVRGEHAPRVTLRSATLTLQATLAVAHAAAHRASVRLDPPPPASQPFEDKA